MNKINCLSVMMNVSFEPSVAAVSVAQTQRASSASRDAVLSAFAHLTHSAYCASEIVWGDGAKMRLWIKNLISKFRNCKPCPEVECKSQDRSNCKLCPGCSPHNPDLLLYCSPALLSRAIAPAPLPGSIKRA